MRIRTGMWAAVVLVAVIAAGCGSTAAEDQREPEGTAEVTIVGKDNVFEPETVEIKAGREYEFVFKNQGTTVHMGLCSAW